MTPKFKVYTYCATYNHSKYIKDTLNGFCMQKTNFPFVCAIKDDASTDGEPEIIRQYLEDNFDFTDSSVAYKKETEYGHVFFAQHKDNKNCYFAVVLLKENHYSQKKDVRPYFQEWREGVPYIALCEGDDYWTDSHKLQKQVEYMDKHPDFSMCFHSAIEHFQDNRRKDRIFSKICDKEYSGLELFERWIVPTASMIIRKEVYTSQIYQTLCSDSRIIYGDIRLVLSSASYGRVYGFSDCMSVYRRHEQGAIFRKSCLDIWKQQKQLEAFAEHLGVDYLNLSKTKRVYRCVRGLYMAIARKDYKFIHVFCEEAFAINAVKASIAIVSYPVSFVIKRFFKR